MLTDVIKFEQKDCSAIIRLNRPQVHNAVNEEVMDGLEVISDRVYSDPDIMVIIITGAGRESFCSGGDLKHFADLKTRDRALMMSKRMQTIMNRFWTGDRVVMGAINGQALGGGCEILTACHFRIAAEHATFSFRQAANGLITGWGGGVRLLKLVGRTRALRLLLTSKLVDASEAQHIGFIDQVVPSEQLMNAALDLAEMISGNSHRAVRAFLKVAGTLEMGGIEKAVESETELFGDLWMGEDFRKWLRSFLEQAEI